MKPIQIDEDNFKSEVLESDLPVLADFYAPWCGPCRTLAPVVEELAAEYAGKLKMVKINTDDNENLPGRYEIASIPCLLLFHNGKLAERVSVGVKAKSELKSALDAYLTQAAVA